MIDMLDGDEHEVDSIIVAERARSVHRYTQAGEVLELGTIVTRNYQNEQAQRHYFISTREDGGDLRSTPKIYRLGVTTTQFRFVDHTVAIDPFLNRGYGVQDMIISHGGMNMYAVLSRPQARVIKDPIDWDLQYWPSEQSQKPRELRESIVVFSAIRPGKAITYRRGWFRLICTNGLVAEILNLGTMKFNHNTWSSTTLTQNLDLLPKLNETIDLGPYIGTRRGAHRLGLLLEQLSISASEEGSEKVDPKALEELPLFIRDEVGTFLRMPKWFLLPLAQQFYSIAELDRRIFALDVVNAITNPVNLERFQSPSPHSILRPLTRSNALTSAASKLLGAFSL